MTILKNKRPTARSGVRYNGFTRESRPAKESNTIFDKIIPLEKRTTPGENRGQSSENKKLSVVHSAGRAYSVHRAVRPDRAVAAVGPASAGHRHPAVGRACPGRLGAVGRDFVGSDCS